MQRSVIFLDLFSTGYFWEVVKWLHLFPRVSLLFKHSFISMPGLSIRSAVSIHKMYELMVQWLVNLKIYILAV